MYDVHLGFFDADKFSLLGFGCGLVVSPFVAAQSGRGMGVIGSAISPSSGSSLKKTASARCASLAKNGLVDAGISMT